MENSYKFFHNTACEFSPCHSDMKSEDINCMMCFCPAYSIKDCPGIKAGLGVVLDNGIKDCSGCSLPHKAENYKLFSQIHFNGCSIKSTDDIETDLVISNGRIIFTNLYIDIEIIMENIGDGSISSYVIKTYGEYLRSDYIDSLIKYLREYRFIMSSS
jgi:Zn-finger protein